MEIDMSKLTFLSTYKNLGNITLFGDDLWDELCDLVTTEMFGEPHRRSVEGYEMIAFEDLPEQDIVEVVIVEGEIVGTINRPMVHPADQYTAIK
jgi:hypothetical protein